MKNKRKGFIKNGIGYIPLTRGLLAKVDRENIKWLSSYNWFALGKKQPRAVRHTRKSGHLKAIWMSREILGVTRSEIDVDHKNHDTLDNRRRNLRKATRSQNNRNTTVQRNNTSGHKGITWVCRDRKWLVRIQKHGEVVYRKYFNTLTQAVNAHEVNLTKIHGKFAFIGGNK